VPRTGGVSVEMAFIGRPSDERHRTWASIYADKDIREWDAYRFTIIRNTYSRILSFFRHHARAKWLSKEDSAIFGEDSPKGFRNWAERGFPSHVEGELDKSIFQGNDFLKILPFLKREDSADFREDFSSILNTENLANEFEEMCRRIGVFVPHGLRKVNASHKDYEMDAYDSHTIKLVQKEFGEELETFKYKIP
jgi:hypothetical protein